MKITMRDLEGAVRGLNSINGFKEVSYNTVGAYILDGAYGGWKLARVVNEQGGQEDISSGGFMSKSELYYQVQAIKNYHYSTQTVNA